MGREKERERERVHAHARGRESPRESTLAPPFICFFFHLGLPYANWAQPGVLFVLSEVFTLVLGPSFDLPCLLATAILDSFSLFYLPNNANLKNAIIIIICVKVPFDCKLFIWIPYIHTL